MMHKRFLLLILSLAPLLAGCASASQSRGDPLYGYMMESQSKGYQARRSLRALSATGL